MSLIHSDEEYRKVIVEGIQEPLKDILNNFSDGKLTPKDFLKMYRIYKNMMLLPSPTKDNVNGHNAHITIDARDKFFEHLKRERYEKTFRPLFDFAIIKIGFDNLYEDFVSWLLAELIRSGWRFKEHNRPSIYMWKPIPPTIRERLKTKIEGHYEGLKERQNIEGFFNDVLESFESEVESWNVA